MLWYRGPREKSVKMNKTRIGFGAYLSTKSTFSERPERGCFAKRHSCVEGVAQSLPQSRDVPIFQKVL